MEFTVSVATTPRHKTLTIFYTQNASSYNPAFTQHLNLKISVCLAHRDLRNEPKTLTITVQFTCLVVQI